MSHQNRSFVGFSYLSSYLDDPHCNCLQSESFSPVNTPYSSTKWTLKFYPRGLNEKQSTNHHFAIFLKYLSGTTVPIKAKAEFSLVNRSNELVMLRSTNFHTFSSGNDWGYSGKAKRRDLSMFFLLFAEFLDGNYLNSRRNDLLSDDRLRIHVRVILVDERETLQPEFSSSIHGTTKNQAAASSSASSVALFNTEKERSEAFDLFSNQFKLLLDDQRFTDVHIHVLPKPISSSSSTTTTTTRSDDLRKSPRLKRNSSSSSSVESIVPRRTTRSIALRSASNRSACSSCDLEETPHPTPKIEPLATFFAHRAILVARSSVFAEQLRLDHPHRLKSPPIDVYIDDLHPVTVRAMLFYIYTGRLPSSKEESSSTLLNPIDLFRAAVKYHLNELRDIAKTTMLDVLKIDNAIEMLEVSDQANDLALKEKVFSFVRSNASAVSKTNHWFNISQRHPHLIIDAFRSLVTTNAAATTTKLNGTSISQHSSSSTTTTKYSKID